MRVSHLKDAKRPQIIKRGAVRRCIDHKPSIGDDFNKQQYQASTTAPRTLLGSTATTTGSQRNTYPSVPHPQAKKGEKNPDSTLGLESTPAVIAEELKILCRGLNDVVEGYDSLEATRPGPHKTGRRGRRGIRKLKIPDFEYPLRMASFLKLKCDTLASQIYALKASRGYTTLESQARRSEVLAKREQELESLIDRADEMMEDFYPASKHFGQPRLLLDAREAMRISMGHVKVERLRDISYNHNITSTSLDLAKPSIAWPSKPTVNPRLSCGF
ncbi:hypothetical protein F5Y10DRAFT_258858 [Nemania abortiva]|nr:hypothetical protein F5Y10DRAFT_258858 [Nemania abortiva]